MTLTSRLSLLLSLALLAACATHLRPAVTADPHPTVTLTLSFR